MSAVTHVFWRDGARNITDVVHPVTGGGGYSGLSREELDAREGGPHRVVTWEEAAALVAEADRVRYCTGAQEVTQERADDALNCLPPFRWSRSAHRSVSASSWEAFAVGEPLTDTLRTWFVRLGRRWFEITEDRSVSYEELIAAVKSSPCFSQPEGPAS